MTDQERKFELLTHCKTNVNNRLGKIKQNISDIEDSLLEESKSSAGDKHETGRAMLQIDRENAGKQLQEIEQLVALLQKIDVKTITPYARLGSLVYTNNGIYFLSISIGQVTIGKTLYICIALNAPLGQLLLGKQKGDVIQFNGKNITIKSIS